MDAAICNAFQQARNHGLWHASAEIKVNFDVNFFATLLETHLCETYVDTVEVHENSINVRCHSDLPQNTLKAKRVAIQRLMHKAAKLYGVADVRLDLRSKGMVIRGQQSPMEMWKNDRQAAGLATSDWGGAGPDFCIAAG